MAKRSNQHINFAIVLRMQGWLLLIEAAFMLLPLIVSWLYDETTALWSFIYSTAITAGADYIVTEDSHFNHLKKIPYNSPSNK